MSPLNWRTFLGCNEMKDEDERRCQRDVKETPPAIASFENGRRESEGKKHG